MNISCHKIDIMVLLILTKYPELPSTLFQTVVEIELVKKAVLPEVPNLNVSVMKENQEEQTQFPPEKKIL